MSTKTPELLADRLSTELESLYEDTEFQFIGSVGRHAILNSYGEAKRPLLAFRPNGELRDIDTMGHTENITLPDNLLESSQIDLNPNAWVRGEAGEVWVTFPGDSSIAEKVRSEVFEPVVRPLGDVACRTYSATTQRALDHLVPVRFKDVRKFRAFDRFVTSLDGRPDVLEGDVPLPDEFYAPFTRFRQAVKEKHPEYFWLAQAAAAVSYLPPSLKSAARRVGAPLRHRYSGQ